MTKDCEFCGRSFSAERQRTRFCSQSCFAQHLVVARGQGGQVESVCDNCGSEFKAPASAERRFCSAECFREDRRVNKIGRQAFDTGIKICEQCGKSFERQRHPNGNFEGPQQFLARRYCSRKCSDDRDLVEEFWSKVQKSEDGCWVWIGRTVNGYGNFWLPGGPAIGAHVYSMILEHGSVPDGLQVCHRCDNPPCVRPSHLYFGTPSENMRDAKIRGKRHNKTKLTVDDVLAIRDKYQEVGYEQLLHVDKASINNELMNLYGVSIGTLYGIRVRRTWHYV